MELGDYGGDDEYELLERGDTTNLDRADFISTKAR